MTATLRWLGLVGVMAIGLIAVGPKPVHVVTVEACDGCDDANAVIQSAGTDLSVALDNYNSANAFCDNWLANGGKTTDQPYVDAAQASCDEADIINADVTLIDFEVQYKKMMGCPM